MDGAAKKQMSRDWSVYFQPSGARLRVTEGTSLLVAIRRAGIDFETPCNGKGECKQCRVSVLNGVASIREEDAPYLSPDEIADGYLLACRTPVVSDLTVFVPDRD
jgi:uncharacterized 2Fe-2S/4Fe-4S cluster protein (DUF4445 family)